MDEKAKHFARRVLLIHALLLVAVATVVFFAARAVFRTATHQVIDQNEQEQALLAGQTAGGIESFFDSIRSDLDLLRRTDIEESATQPASGAVNPATTQPALQATPAGTGGLFGGRPAGTRPAFDATANLLSGRLSEAIAGVMWRQLQTRASMLLVVDRDKLPHAESGPVETRAIHVVGPVEQFSSTFRGPTVAVWDQATQIVDKARIFLRTVDQPTISPFLALAAPAGADEAKTEAQGVVLVCIPMQERGRRVLIAVVPMREIEARFLDKMRDTTASSSQPATRPAHRHAGTASLLDETTAVMASSDRTRVGKNASDVTEPRVRALVDQFVSTGQSHTTVIDAYYSVDGIQRSPRIISVEPVKVMDKRWMLVISSPLADVQAVVQGLFSEVVWWGVFVVISVTGILVSTSLQLIRARTRLERVRHEVLQREVSQAREIQLAWLPGVGSQVLAVDIAAANTPASQISGDFYNWFELSDARVVVTIGDVTGHGIAAAFLMATTQLLVRTTMLRLGDPGQCLEEVNAQLCSQVFNGQFVTMLILVLDPRHGKIEAAVAGHYPPLISDGESFQPLNMEYQLVLGVEKQMRYPTERFDLPAKASLLLYTDGVLDVRNAHGDRFEAAGLQRSLYGRVESSQAMVDLVEEAVDKFRGTQALPDDLTMVAIQVQTTAAARPERAVPSH